MSDAPGSVCFVDYQLCFVIGESFVRSYFFSVLSRWGKQICFIFLLLVKKKGIDLHFERGRLVERENRARSRNEPNHPTTSARPTFFLSVVPEERATDLIFFFGCQRPQPSSSSSGKKKSKSIQQKKPAFDVAAPLSGVVVDF